MFNSLKSSFTTFHRKITSKPFFQKTLNNNQKIHNSFTTSNGNLKISTKELHQLLHRLGYNKEVKASKEVEEIVRGMDSDRDGFVDMEELFKEEEDGDDVLMEAFLIFDCDKNGLICAEELKRILSKLGWRKCGLKDCKRMIEGVDKDGDGFVNFQDFRLMMKARR